MCGIVGIASKVNIDNYSWLNGARDTMIHRGPDDAGEWWSDNGNIGLGHRRLSIIELSNAGHQPMLDFYNRYVITFNGEIYNFQELRIILINLGFIFNTYTDTEVILNGYRAWGPEVLSKLNGMFAFCIYDIEKNSLFIARDRAGEKPLFYSLVNNVFKFSSELKALLFKQTNYVNYDSFDCYLSMGFVPGNLSIVKGVNKLPPAHFLQFDLNSGELEIRRYWQIPEFNNQKIDEDELIFTLDELLNDTIKKQLVADVPIGVLLSGGLDSSLITAFAARSKKDLKTFTVRFPGYSQFDETKHARLISNHFNTNHIELDAADATVDILPLLAKQFDEPIIDSSMIPTYLVSNLIKSHCTVALGGDGGDELFGGYNHYSRLLMLENKLKFIHPIIRKNAAIFSEIFLPLGFKGRNWMQGLNIDFSTGLPLIASYFDKLTRKKLLNNNQLTLNAELIRQGRIPITQDIIQRSTRTDFENYLPEDILVKVDRASMLNSLEIRAPFLDYRIIEFAFSRIPTSLKANTSNKKIILKKLAKKLLPNEFDFNRKQGFSIPLSEWLKRGSWINYFEDVLLSDNDTIFDKKLVLQMINGQKNGRSNSERLFALVLFELWRKEYNIKF
jgi:asparagine synthase (glutamine-hydrolysing)